MNGVATRRALLADLFGEAIAALAPERLLARPLSLRGGAVVVSSRNRRVTLRLDAGLLVVGAGKGAAALAHAVEARLGNAIAGGVVIVPTGHGRPLERIAVAFGGHPVPDRRSVASTRRLLACIETRPRRPVLVLLTGGASSLLVAPARGLTLADKRRTTRLLLGCGASIEEVNTVRRHLSAVKGGRLAARITTAAAALVVSDVPTDDVAAIGSGPTVRDDTTPADALAVVERYALPCRLPRAVVRRLRRNERSPGRDVPTFIIGRNAPARGAVARAARRRGLHVLRLRRPLSGSTAIAGRRLAAAIVRARARLVPGSTAVLVAGGETTVRLGTNPGRGGRNQELALTVALALAGVPGWMVLCAGTDGIDGPTHAAGAFADATTVARARRCRRSVEDALARHDALPLLAELGDLHVTGPTGTNVADLAVAIVWRRSSVAGAGSPWHDRER